MRKNGRCLSISASKKPNFAHLPDEKAETNLTDDVAELRTPRITYNFNPDSEAQNAGSAIGSNLFATSLGGAVGPIIFGLIVDHAGGYMAAWTATGALVLAGAILVAFGFKEDQSATKN